MALAFWTLDERGVETQPIDAIAIDGNINLDFEPGSDVDQSTLETGYVEEVLGTRGAWDVGILNGLRLPGVWTFTLKASTRLAGKNPKGISAARVEFAGYEPCSIKGKGLIWTETHWRIWSEDILPMVRPKNSTSKPAPICIAHPMIDSYEVHRVLVKSVSGPHDTGTNPAGKQVKAITIDFLEYLDVVWKKTESGAGSSKNDKLITADGQKIGLEGLWHTVAAFGSDVPHAPVSPEDDLSFTGPQSQLPIVVEP